MTVASVSRNARWHYLSALANNGLGNTILATEHISKAVQMEPNNSLYRRLYQQFRSAGQTYENNAKGFDMYAAHILFLKTQIPIQKQSRNRIQICKSHSRFSLFKRIKF